jgi:hypothetical protein
MQETYLVSHGECVLGVFLETKRKKQQKRKRERERDDSEEGRRKKRKIGKSRIDKSLAKKKAVLLWRGFGIARLLRG